MKKDRIHRIKIIKPIMRKTGETVGSERCRTKIITPIIIGITGIKRISSSVLPSCGEEKNIDIIKKTKETPAIIKIIFSALFIN